MSFSISRKSNSICASSAPRGSSKIPPGCGSCAAISRESNPLPRSSKVKPKNRVLNSGVIACFEGQVEDHAEANSPRRRRQRQASQDGRRQGRAPFYASAVEEDGAAIEELSRA